LATEGLFLVVEHVAIAESEHHTMKQSIRADGRGGNEKDESIVLVTLRVMVAIGLASDSRTA